MKNLTITENPLVLRDLTILRKKGTDTTEFRNALRRIAYTLAIEISKKFKLAEMDVETPLEITTGYYLSKSIVLVPVLRAGLSLVNSFLEMMPDARVGHIGLRRDEDTLQPIDYYYKTPKNLESSVVILLDPMLATGGSASAAITYLKEKGAKDVLLSTLICAPEGVERVYGDHPDVLIYTAALDRQLNENGYILPGLGDAGDRTFGTL
mgnify:CR=1 FL=1